MINAEMSNITIIVDKGHFLHPFSISLDPYDNKKNMLNKVLKSDSKSLDNYILGFKHRLEFGNVVSLEIERYDDILNITIALTKIKEYDKKVILSLNRVMKLTEDDNQSMSRSISNINSFKRGSERGQISFNRSMMNSFEIYCEQTFFVRNSGPRIMNEFLIETVSKICDKRGHRTKVGVWSMSTIILTGFLEDPKNIYEILAGSSENLLRNVSLYIEDYYLEIQSLVIRCQPNNSDKIIRAINNTLRTCKIANLINECKMMIAKVASTNSTMDEGTRRNRERIILAACDHNKCLYEYIHVNERKSLTFVVPSFPQFFVTVNRMFRECTRHNIPYEEVSVYYAKIMADEKHKSCRHTDFIVGYLRNYFNDCRIRHKLCLTCGIGGGGNLFFESLDGSILLRDEVLFKPKRFLMMVAERPYISYLYSGEILKYYLKGMDIGSLKSPVKRYIFLGTIGLINQACMYLVEPEPSTIKIEDIDNTIHDSVCNITSSDKEISYRDYVSKCVSIKKHHKDFKSILCDKHCFSGRMLKSCKLSQTRLVFITKDKSQYMVNSQYMYRCASDISCMKTSGISSSVTLKRYNGCISLSGNSYNKYCFITLSRFSILNYKGSPRMFHIALTDLSKLIRSIILLYPECIKRCVKIVNDYWVTGSSKTKRNNFEILN